MVTLIDTIDCGSLSPDHPRYALVVTTAGGQTGYLGEQGVYGPRPRVFHSYGAASGERALTVGPEMWEPGILDATIVPLNAVARRELSHQ